MVLTPSKAYTMMFTMNFALPHSKTTPNTTSFVGVTTLCANWTLMGLATFVATHLSCVIALGFTNECMAPKSKRHNNPLIPTLNISKIKFRLNLATFIFAINPPCVGNYAFTFSQSLAKCPNSLRLKYQTLVMFCVLFSSKVLLSLGGFLSHILFWPLFGPLAICIVFPILILIVSCKTCNVPTFLCMVYHPYILQPSSFLNNS